MIWLVCAALWRPGLATVVIVLVATGWMGVARLVRGEVLGVKSLALVRGSPGREEARSSTAEFEFEEAEADFRAALERLRRTHEKSALGTSKTWRAGYGVERRRHV